MIRDLWWRRREPASRGELAGLLPAPGDPVLAPGRRTLLEEHLMSEIDRENATQSSPAPQRRPRRRLALLAAPVAVAAVVAGGFALVGESASPDDGRARQDDPPASRPLTLALAAERIAHAAADDGAVEPGPGQFIYVESEWFSVHHEYTSMGELSPSEGESLRREFWMSPDGWDGMFIGHGEDPECVRLGDRWGGVAEMSGGDVTLTVPGEVPDCHGAVDPGEGNPNPEEPGHGSYDWLAQLPTEPGALLDWLYEETEGQGNNPEDGVFQAVTEMITESVMPPDLAAAIYEAAAGIPDVELVDEAVDAAGREGIAIARTERGQRTELIFDAETYEYLGHRSVLVRDQSGLEEGTVMGSSAVLQRAVVEELGERPGE
ncbi:CU044_5270 family protein [Streptomyces sp. 6N223]|uniref:CU044_5270 family protein n=1 Tax=Streptomyces sp. 6N223 TaxID=3457412 RepID=UPI003FD22AD4